jgi:hypothetical protein
MAFKVEIVNDELRIVLPLNTLSCALCGTKVSYKPIDDVPAVSVRNRAPDDYLHQELDGWHWLSVSSRRREDNLVACPRCSAPLDAAEMSVRALREAAMAGLAQKFLDRQKELAPAPKNPETP